MLKRHRFAWSGSVRCAVVVACTAFCGVGSAARADLQQSPYFISSSSQGEMTVSVAHSDGDLLTFRAASSSGVGMFGLRPSAPPTNGGTLITIWGLDFATQQISPPSMSRDGAMCFTDLDVDGRRAIFARSAGGTLLTIRGTNFGEFAGAWMGGLLGTIYGDHRTAAGASLLAIEPGGTRLTIIGDNFGAREFRRARSAGGGRTYVLVSVFPVNGVADSGILSVGDDGTIITIAGSDSFGGIRGPAVSGQTAVFSGHELSSGFAGVFARSPGGVLLTLAGGNFLTPTEFSEPAANDAGAVVFARLDPAGGVERIDYTDMFGSPLRTLVAVGDPLLDSTVAELFFNPDGLNQASEFAYGARLADGRTAIMVASGIPAPGAAALLGLAAIGASRRRR